VAWAGSGLAAVLAPQQLPFLTVVDGAVTLLADIWGAAIEPDAVEGAPAVKIVLVRHAGVIVAVTALLVPGAIVVIVVVVGDAAAMAPIIAAGIVPAATGEPRIPEEERTGDAPGEYPPNDAAAVASRSLCCWCC